MITILCIASAFSLKGLGHGNEKRDDPESTNRLDCWLDPTGHVRQRQRGQPWISLRSRLSAAGRLVQGGFPIFLNKPDLQKARWAKPLSVDKLFIKAFDGSNPEIHVHCVICGVHAVLELQFQDRALHDGWTYAHHFSYVSTEVSLFLFYHHRPPVFRTLSRRCRDSSKQLYLGNLQGGVPHARMCYHKSLLSEIPNENFSLRAWGSEVFLSSLVSGSFWSTFRSLLPDISGLMHEDIAHGSRLVCSAWTGTCSFRWASSSSSQVSCTTTCFL